MGIGASLFLIAVGAILTFALHVHQVGGVSLDVIGWILMVVGVLGLIVTVVIWGGRRRTVVTAQPASYRRVEERSDLEPPDAL
jgi:uncharacterized iron-regulated membrane protein